MDLLYILGHYSTACVYFCFRWGPFVYSLWIVQWNFIRRDHPGNPRRVSGSGPVISHEENPSPCLTLDHYTVVALLRQ